MSSLSHGPPPNPPNPPPTVAKFSSPDSLSLRSPPCRHLRSPLLTSLVSFLSRLFSHPPPPKKKTPKKLSASALLVHWLALNLFHILPQSYFGLLSSHCLHCREYNPRQFIYRLDTTREALFEGSEKITHESRVGWGGWVQRVPSTLSGNFWMGAYKNNHSEGMRKPLASYRETT